MPALVIDTEQAELIEIAVTMLEAALTARTRRADPEAIISNSLKLQSNKLATVRALLKAPDPPDWSKLSPTFTQRALSLFENVTHAEDPETADAHWRLLRALINAPGFPGDEPTVVSPV